MSCQKGYVVILTFWKPDWDWIENDALFSLKASHIFFFLLFVGNYSRRRLVFLNTELRPDQLILKLISYYNNSEK